MKEDHKLAWQRKWIVGCKTFEEVKEKAKAFALEGVLDKIKCPYLIVHGGYDVLGVERVRIVSEYIKSKNMTNVTIVVAGEDDTGAERSAGRRVGKECVRTGRSQVAPVP